MKLSLKLMAALSAIALLSACETPNAGGGGVNGDGTGQNNPYGVDGGGTLPGTNISDRVFFDYDSSVITAEGESVLQAQVGYLNQNSQLGITIEGHCDERGTREYNLALGERRAAAAKRYLVSQGVSSQRINTVSFGKERPAMTGSDEGSWAQNRRAVTVVAQ